MISNLWYLWDKNFNDGKGIEAVQNIRQDTAGKIRKVVSSASNVYESVHGSRIPKQLFLAKTVDEAKKCYSKGDHLYVFRSTYCHHGIYDGDGYVIEYNNYIVQRVPIEQFADRGVILKKNSRKIYKADEIVERAYSRIGERKYNVLTNNCQHFAQWCRNDGKDQSQRELEGDSENSELEFNCIYSETYGNTTVTVSSDQQVDVQVRTSENGIIINIEL